MYSKRVSAVLFVVLCAWLVTENVTARKHHPMTEAPSTEPSAIREKRDSPMDMIAAGAGMAMDVIQQGVAAGHAGSLAIGTNRRKIKTRYIWLSFTNVISASR